MASKAFIRSLIKRGDGLFTLIHQFNFDITGYVDASHIQETLLVKYWPQVSRSKRACNKLSHYLLHTLGLEDKIHYDFEDPRLRIALIDYDSLDKLLVYAGAALYSDRISRMIMKTQVQSLQASVGPKVCFFATKKAPLLKALMPQVELAPITEKLTKEVFFDAGKRCLEMCLAHESQAVLNRLKLKFPAGIHWDFNADTLEDKKTKAWNYLHRLLTKEVEPKWKPCFT